MTVITMQVTAPLVFGLGIAFGLFAGYVIGRGR